MPKSKHWTQENAVLKQRENKEKILELRVKNEHYYTDIAHESRHQKGLCRYCFYLQDPGFAGQALTSYICPMCHQERMNSDTNVPPICPNCAKANHLCSQCGADID